MWQTDKINLFLLYFVLMSRFESIRAGFATAKGDLRLGWISKTKTVITNLWKIPSFAPETIYNSAVTQTNCVDSVVQPGTFISSQEVRQNSLCQSG